MHNNIMSKLKGCVFVIVCTYASSRDAFDAFASVELIKGYNFPAGKEVLERLCP